MQESGLILISNFKGFHCGVIDLVEEDKQVLLEEQAKLDDHEDRVTDLMSRLLDLGGRRKERYNVYCCKPF